MPSDFPNGKEHIRMQPTENYLPKANIAPENGGWETTFLLGNLIFICELLVSGRVTSKICPPIFLWCKQKSDHPNLAKSLLRLGWARLTKKSVALPKAKRVQESTSPRKS